MPYTNQTNPFQPNWITDKIDENTILFAEQLAKHLSNVNEFGESLGTPNTVPLTTSQLRKFFGAVKNIQLTMETKSFDSKELIMLKPKLAYAVGRARKNNERKKVLIEDFEYVINQAIDHVSNKDSFKNFINFFEAIVAYQKRYGKDK